MKIIIGNILKNMRILNTKYTQKMIGDKMGLASNTISSYERENSQPDFETIIKYSKICGYELRLYNKKTNEVVSLEEMSKEM